MAGCSHRHFRQTPASPWASEASKPHAVPSSANVGPEIRRRRRQNSHYALGPTCKQRQELEWTATGLPLSRTGEAC